jgi:hypothetical protein
MRTKNLILTMSSARQDTIRRFTNLLDGSILPKASVSQIIDYYEALKNGSNITVKNNCNITNRFLEEEIKEYENDEECY